MFGKQSLVVTLCLAMPALVVGQLRSKPERNAPESLSPGLDPNNILVSSRTTVQEFTPAGVLVQTIPFTYGGRPYPPGERIGDIAVDQYGWINLFNGGFNPFMSRYSPATGTQVHKTFPGWNSCGCGSNSGPSLTTYGDFVFAADWDSTPGPATGIIRFDVFRNTAARFLDGRTFIDLNIGLDRKLYAVSGATVVEVYDPVTMELLGQIAPPPELPHGIYKIAVDERGQIFAATSLGRIARLSPSGALEAVKTLGNKTILDIDIDDTGRIIVADDGGRVFVGDASLMGDFTSFLGADPTGGLLSVNVGFARPVPAPQGVVPSPTPTPAPAPTPVPIHNIVLSLGWLGGRETNSFREFTPGGTLLRKVRNDYPLGDHGIRDIVTDPEGGIYSVSATTPPVLTRFSWLCRTFQHTTFAGWNPWPTYQDGGIGRYQNYVFSADATGSGGGPKGIIRLDTSTNTATRFLSTITYYDLTVGLDGKLYIASAGWIDVYDAISMQFLRRIAAPSGAFGRLAIDQSGTIFTYDSYGTVYRLGSNGVVEEGVATGFPLLMDIAIDEAGTLVLAQAEGYILSGDRTLQNFTFFKAIEDGNHWWLHIDFVPLTTAPPLLPISVTSEKVHGGAGTFALNLPLSGPRATESRTGGPSGDHTMVFTFAESLLEVGSVCTSNGTIRASRIDPNDPHRFIVKVTEARDVDYVVVTLNHVRGSDGSYSETVAQEMGLLPGDAIGESGAVNSADISLIKTQSGSSVSAANFRADVNLSGVINAADISLVKSKSGSVLGSYP